MADPHIGDITTYPGVNLIMGLGRYAGFNIDFNHKSGLRIVLGWLSLSIWFGDLETMASHAVQLNRQMTERVAFCKYCHKRQ